MDTFAWHMPVQLRFGADALRAVSDDLGQQPCIVMALEPAARLGLQDEWRAVLGDRLHGWITVPEGLGSLAVARELSRSLWPLLEATPRGVLVGLGGGSVLDLAKLLRCRPRDGSFEPIAQALRRTRGWPALERQPLWLVPTTAGTGSEVTRWATVWDTDGPQAGKLSFDEPFGWAERAYVDPALGASCPPAVTRDCALDALSHALESIWNIHANPVSDQLAVAAARGIIAALPQALRTPADPLPRRELALAALRAGLAFSQTRTALAHALSYELTLVQGTPHGLACAIWLASAWSLALGVHSRVDQRLAEVFGCPPAEGLRELESWLRQVGVDPDPQQHGIADASRRLRSALGSVRGRNFIATLDRVGREHA
jgi:phosphonate metabolism-associated iron-containing alcohol dehydrogenase